MSPFMSIVAIYCKGTFNTWPKIKTFAASFRFATCTKHVYEKKITAVMAPLVLDLRFKPLTDSIRYVDNTYVTLYQEIDIMLLFFFGLLVIHIWRKFLLTFFYHSLPVFTFFLLPLKIKIVFYWFAEVSTVIPMVQKCPKNQKWWFATPIQYIFFAYQ